MNIDEFRKSFIESVRSIAAETQNFLQAAFVEYASAQLEEIDEIADTEISYFRGVGTRKRAVAVDAYSFDSVDDSVRMLIADWRGGDEAETVTQTDATSSFNRLRAFVEDSLSGRLPSDLEESSPAAALSSEIFTRKTALTRFRLYLITDAALSTRVHDWPEDRIGDIPAEFHIWDITRFHRVYESKTGRDELEVDFTEFDKAGIPCISASVESDDYRAYLCVIPGRILAEIYDRFGSRLLEGNVRSFLSVKGKANKGIRNTILNEPGLFFAYNNGIAVTATDVDVVSTGGITRLKSAKDLQIVNGGQTTALLANGLRDKADLQHIFVQMKLSVVSAEKSEEIIPRISRYANTQNKVSDADFFSNHPFHRRMEEISRRLWAPAVGGAQYETHWFYERARGQYLNAQTNLSATEKGRFVRQHPRDQMMTKTDLAKFENSWRGLPHRVCLGAQKNFMIFAEFIGTQWEHSELDFNDEYFRRVVAKAILYRHTERLVSAQGWYVGDYRAQIVAYTVAKLAHMVSAVSGGKLLDLRAIWTKQAISPATEQQLVSISEKVFHVITTPEGGLQNFGEWSKKELCWNRVQSAQIPMASMLAKELVSEGEERSYAKGARKDQSVISGIQAQARVVELGSTYWIGLRDWARSRQLIDSIQDKLLSVAARIPSRIPPDFQCLELLRIKESMEDEGYPAQN